MFTNISSSYNGMDSIFQQADLPDPGKDSRKVNMEMRSEGGRHMMCMQVVESKIIPFSFLFIGDAAWKYLSNANEEEQRTGFHRVCLFIFLSRNCFFLVEIVGARITLTSLHIFLCLL